MTFNHDLRYALRAMIRTPVSTAVAVLSVALGVGATTTVFTLINGLMFRPLPVRDPGLLVEVLSRYPGEPRMNVFPWRFYERYRDRSRVFSDLIGSSPGRFRVAANHGDAETVVGEYVVGHYFAALGIQAAIGRVIEPADDRLEGGDPAVAVVSWAYWDTRWQRSAPILGSRIVVEGVAATVIGVTPREFAGLQPGLEPRVWMPAAMETLVRRPSRRLSGELPLQLAGRLAPGVTLEQARAELRVLDRERVEELAARSRNPRWRLAQIDLQPARAGLTALRDALRQPLLGLMAVTSLLLTIACTNVAGLLLARAIARRREIAVRVALGAGRLRLVQLLLAEALLLSVAGGALGTTLAFAGARGLARAWPIDPRMQTAEIPVHLDVRVLMFSAALVIATTVLFGLAPGWRGFRNCGAPLLRHGGAAGDTPSRRLAGKGLVVAQIALAVVLLSAAALFTGEVLALRSRDLGFDPRSVLLVRLDPSQSGHKPAELSPLYETLLGRMQSIPGVTAATLCAVSPIDPGQALRFVTVPGFHEMPADRRYVALNWVGPDYFAVVRTPIVAGRAFTASDGHGSNVAIVNQAFARYYFGDGTAIGRQFTFEGQRDAYEIVGVAADARYSSLREPPPRTAYLNVFQDGGGRFSQFALRTSGAPTAIAGEVRRAVSEVLKTVPISRMTTLSDQVDASLKTEWLMARLSGTLGTAGAFLAALGIYGLMTFTTARRSREIALRMALGATRRDAVMFVMKGGTALAAAGVSIGVPLAICGARVAASLVNIAGERTAAFAVSAVAMAAVALVAAYVPARRAARLEPMQVLRE
jgi:predicted permease